MRAFIYFEVLNKCAVTEKAIKVLYMSFDRFLLAVESRDLSQAEKESTACKAE